MEGSWTRFDELYELKPGDPYERGQLASIRVLKDGRWKAVAHFNCPPTFTEELYFKLNDGDKRWDDQHRAVFHGSKKIYEVDADGRDIDTCSMCSKKRVPVITDNSGNALCYTCADKKFPDGVID
jgi:hypothetical protein